MQDRQVMSFLAYVWALGIVPTSTSVSADSDSLDFDQNETVLFDADAIKTEAELQAALSDPETVAITLASDIITIDNLIVNRNDSVELNLNGFKIASLSQNARVIDVQAGDLALLGLGSIVATGTGASAIRIRGAITADNTNYSHVMVGADVTLYAPNYYGIFITTAYNAAYGVTVDFYGSIIARDGICIHGNIQGHGDNIPHINIQDGAKIIVDETEGTVLCAFGSGLWEVGAAELTGGTGINVKSGILNLRGTNLIATGDSDTFPGSGAVVRLENHLAHRIKLQIFSGSYLSVQGYVFYEYHEAGEASSLRALDIYDGHFSGQLGICFGIAPRGSEESATRIYGGKFSADVNRYLAPEHHIESNSAHNEFTVIDDTEPIPILDKATQLKLAKADLEDLLVVAKRYTKPSYAGNELGELQATVNKIIGVIKRGVKASEKLLKSSDATPAKVKNSIRRLEDHLSEIRAIEDAMRAEISEAIDFSKIDSARYTPDSFLDLSLAAADAEQLLAADFVTLVELQDMLGVIDAAKIMLEESDDYEYIPDASSTSLSEPIAPAIIPEPSTIEPVASDLAIVEPIIEEPETDFADSTEMAENLPLPELPLKPAPRLFPSLPEPPATTDIESVLDSFVDEPEPVVAADTEPEIPEPEYDSSDPIAAAFAIDDLEMEELSAVEEFVSQLKTAELIAEPLTEELPSEEPLSEEFPPETQLENLSEPEPEVTAEPVLNHVAPEPPAPVFIDPELITAKQSLRNLLNAISALDPADYITESYAILARTASMAGNLLSEDSPHTTTAVLLSAFNSVNVAYDRLVKKSDNPTGVALETVELNLRSMLDAVQDLTVNDYDPSSAEQFGELQVAIAKAQAILARDLPSLPDILHIMDEIKMATSGLKGADTPITQPEPSPTLTDSMPASDPNPAVENETFIVHQPAAADSSAGQALAAPNWTGFSEVLNDIRALNAAEYTTESYRNLLAVLESAKVLAAKTDVAQDEIDEIVFELNLAILALERPTPPHLSSVQEFSADSVASTPRTALSTADVPRVSQSSSSTPITAPSSLELSADDTITPSLLMSMMAGAYAGLATYRRSRLAAKKRKNFRSAGI